MKNLMPIAIIAAMAVGLFMYLKKGTKKLFKMAEFKFKGLKVGKPIGFRIPVFVNLEIYNPSDFEVPIKKYKVEIYQVDGEVTKLLSTSNEANTKVPANSSVINKITFNLNAMQVLGVAVSALSWDWNKIADNVQSELAGKVKLKVYAEVYNQFLEREIKI